MAKSTAFTIENNGSEERFPLITAAKGQVKGKASMVGSIVKSQLVQVSGEFIPEIKETFESVGSLTKELKDSYRKQRQIKKMIENGLEVSVEIPDNESIEYNKARINRLMDNQLSINMRDIVDQNDMLYQQKFDSGQHESYHRGSTEHELSSEPFGRLTTHYTPPTQPSFSNATKLRNIARLQKEVELKTAQKVFTEGDRYIGNILNLVGTSIMKQNEKLWVKREANTDYRFTTHMKYQENILKGVNAIVENLQNVQNKAVEAAFEFYSKNLALTHDIDLKLGAMTDNNQHKNRSSYSGSRVGQADILDANGKFYAKKYAKSVGMNIKDLFKDTMLHGQVDPKMQQGRSFFYNMMKGNMYHNYSMSKIGEALSVLPSLLLGNINSLGRFGSSRQNSLMNKKFFGSNMSIGQLIGQIFGTGSTYVSQARFGLKDPNMTVGWTAKSDKTLNYVIPSYLSKITAALTGQEPEMYDYGRGGFKTESVWRNQLRRDQRAASQNAHTVKYATMINDHARSGGMSLNRDDIDIIFENIQRAGVPVTPSSIKNASLRRQLALGTQGGEQAIRDFERIITSKGFGGFNAKMMSGQLLKQSRNRERNADMISKQISDFGGFENPLLEQDYNEMQHYYQFDPFINTPNRNKFDFFYLSRLKKQKKAKEALADTMGKMHTISGRQNINAATAIGSEGNVEFVNSRGGFGDQLTKIYHLLLKGIYTYEGPGEPDHIPKLLNAEHVSSSRYQAAARARSNQANDLESEIAQLQRDELTGDEIMKHYKNGPISRRIFSALRRSPKKMGGLANTVVGKASGFVGNVLKTTTGVDVTDSGDISNMKYDFEFQADELLANQAADVFESAYNSAIKAFQKRGGQMIPWTVMTLDSEGRPTGNYTTLTDDNGNPIMIPDSPKMQSGIINKIMAKFIPYLNGTAKDGGMFSIDTLLSFVIPRPPVMQVEGAKTGIQSLREYSKNLGKVALQKKVTSKGLFGRKKYGTTNVTDSKGNVVLGNMSDRGAHLNSDMTSEKLETKYYDNPLKKDRTMSLDQAIKKYYSWFTSDKKKAEIGKMHLTDSETGASGSLSELLERAGIQSGSDKALGDFIVKYGRQFKHENKGDLTFFEALGNEPIMGKLRGMFDAGTASNGDDGSFDRFNQALGASGSAHSYNGNSGPVRFNSRTMSTAQKIYDLLVHGVMVYPGSNPQGYYEYMKSLHIPGYSQSVSQIGYDANGGDSVIYANGPNRKIAGLLGYDKKGLPAVIDQGRNGLFDSISGESILEATSQLKTLTVSSNASVDEKKGLLSVISKAETAITDSNGQLSDEKKVEIYGELSTVKSTLDGFGQRKMFDVKKGVIDKNNLDKMPSFNEIVHRGNVEESIKEVRFAIEQMRNIPEEKKKDYLDKIDTVEQMFRNTVDSTHKSGRGVHSSIIRKTEKYLEAIYWKATNLNANGKEAKLGGLAGLAVGTAKVAWKVAKGVGKGIFNVGKGLALVGVGVGKGLFGIGKWVVNYTRMKFKSIRQMEKWLNEIGKWLDSHDESEDQNIPAYRAWYTSLKDRLESVKNIEVETEEKIGKDSVDTKRLQTEIVNLYKEIFKHHPLSGGKGGFLGFVKRGLKGLGNLAGNALGLSVKAGTSVLSGVGGLLGTMVGAPLKGVGNVAKGLLVGNMFSENLKHSGALHDIEKAQKGDNRQSKKIHTRQSLTAKANAGVDFLTKNVASRAIDYANTNHAGIPQWAIDEAASTDKSIDEIIEQSAPMALPEPQAKRGRGRRNKKGQLLLPASHEASILSKNEVEAKREGSYLDSIQDKERAKEMKFYDESLDKTDETNKLLTTIAEGIGIDTKTNKLDKDSKQGTLADKIENAGIGGLLDDKKNKDKGGKGGLFGLISTFIGGKLFKGGFKNAMRGAGRGLKGLLKRGGRGAVNALKSAGKGIGRFGKTLFSKGGVGKILRGAGSGLKRAGSGALKGLGRFGKALKHPGALLKGAGKLAKGGGKGLLSLGKAALKGGKGLFGKGLAKLGGKALAKGAGKALLKGGLKAGLKGGAKALLGATPVGLAINAGLALAEGAWNAGKNAKEWAGLEEGQEATLGQKIGAGLAGTVGSFIDPLGLGYRKKLGGGLYKGGAWLGKKLFGSKEEVDPVTGEVKKPGEEGLLKKGAKGAWNVLKWTNPAYLAYRGIKGVAGMMKGKEATVPQIDPTTGQPIAPETQQQGGFFSKAGGLLKGALSLTPFGMAAGLAGKALGAAKNALSPKVKQAMRKAKIDENDPMNSQYHWTIGSHKTLTEMKDSLLTIGPAITSLKDSFGEGAKSKSSSKIAEGAGELTASMGKSPSFLDRIKGGLSSFKQGVANFVADPMGSIKSGWNWVTNKGAEALEFGKKAFKDFAGNVIGMKIPTRNPEELNKTVDTKGGFAKPGDPSSYLTESFGRYSDMAGKHLGIDIGNKDPNAMNRAMSDGEVIRAQDGWSPEWNGQYYEANKDELDKQFGPTAPFGNHVTIKDKNGAFVTYAHQETNLVKPGDKVKAGQPVGKMGDTGHSLGKHLHLQVYKDGKLVDPLQYMSYGDFSEANIPAGNQSTALTKPSKEAVPIARPVSTGTPTSGGDAGDHEKGGFELGGPDFKIKPSELNRLKKPEPKRQETQQKRVEARGGANLASIIRGDTKILNEALKIQEEIKEEIIRHNKISEEYYVRSLQAFEILAGSVKQQFPFQHQKPNSSEGRTVSYGEAGKIYNLVDSTR